MVEITCQHDTKPLQKLPFCYLCGEVIARGQARNEDHVPPKSMFEVQDRQSPLKLPTHKTCHAPLNHVDEDMQQLVGLLDNRTVRLRMSEDPVTVPENIWRWVRGFHTALYREYLPASTLHTIVPPLQELRVINGHLKIVPIPPFHLQIVEMIKRNRSVNNLDRIAIYNGRVRYECFWGRNSAGSLHCVFALDIYNWFRFSDGPSVTPRGCTGVYVYGGSMPPPEACIGSTIASAYSNHDKADPFGL